MAKSLNPGAAKLRYVCNNCGADAPKWQGQCADCGEWNTLIETTAAKPKARTGSFSVERSAVRRLDEISGEDSERIPTGLPELDRVLGGGMVPGAVILIGGEPGIGKSTLLLQALAALEGRVNTLYVTGEESLTQVSLRARRLGLPRLDLPVLAETGLETILDTLSRTTPGFVVLDSIQTLWADALDAAPGTVSQVRAATQSLIRFAKQAIVASRSSRATSRRCSCAPTRRSLMHSPRSAMPISRRHSRRRSTSRVHRRRPPRASFWAPATSSACCARHREPSFLR